jgi:hypothetical protein
MSEDDKDWLEDVLREEPRYLDDAGFSARVVAAMPRRRKYRWLRTAILTSMSALAVVVGLFVLHGADVVAKGAEALLKAHSLATLPVGPLVLLVLLLGGLIAFASNES